MGLWWFMYHSPMISLFPWLDINDCSAVSDRFGPRGCHDEAGISSSRALRGAAETVTPFFGHENESENGDAPKLSNIFQNCLCNGEDDDGPIQTLGFRGSLFSDIRGVAHEPLHCAQWKSWCGGSGMFHDLGCWRYCNQHQPHISSNQIFRRYSLMLFDDV